MKKKFFLLILVIIMNVLILIGCNNNYGTILKDNGVDITNNITDDNNIIKLKSDKSIIGKLENEIPWFPLNILDSGIICGFAGDDDQNNSAVILYDIQKEKPSTIDTIEDDLRPMIFKENENYIVWIEGVINNSTRKSRLKIYNKTDKTTKTIFENASYVSLDNSPLALNDSFVLWVDYLTENGTLYPIIRKYDIKLQEYSIYKDNATNPVICNNFIAYMAESKEDPNIPSVYIEWLNTEITEEITKSNLIQYMDGYEDSLILSYTDDTKEFYITLYDDKELKPINSNKQSAYEYPKISNDYIMWRDVSGVNIIDRKTKHTIALESKNDISSIRISDKYILWTSPELSEEEESISLNKYNMITSNINISYTKN